MHRINPALKEKEIAPCVRSGSAKRTAAQSYYYRQQGLDEIVLNRCNAVLVGALQDGHQPTRKEIAAILTLRYFTSHGPATAKDLRWWSSLTIVDIKKGIQMVASQLEHEVVD